MMKREEEIEAICKMHITKRKQENAHDEWGKRRTSKHEENTKKYTQKKMTGSRKQRCPDVWSNMTSGEISQTQNQKK
jgi:hypothetical protein